jgi:hypothetical protein
VPDISPRQIIRSEVLKCEYPLADCLSVVRYYALTGKKQSEKYFLKFDDIWDQKYLAAKATNILTSRKQLLCLDIGTGPSIMPWIAIAFGHKCHVTEVSEDSGLIHPQILTWFKDIRHATGMKGTKLIKWNITSSSDYDEFPHKIKQRSYDVIFLHRTNFDIGWITQDYINFLTLLKLNTKRHGQLSWIPPQENYRHIVEALKHLKYTSRWTTQIEKSKKISQYSIQIFPWKMAKIDYEYPTFTGKYYD